MKNQFSTVIIVVLALVQLSVSKATGQSRAACVPVNGYWVLVSNVHVKNKTTVQFYNNENLLMYEEVVQGQKMDISKLKTLRSLKKGLDYAFIAYNQQKKALFDKNWVAVNLKR
jgi:hypothetical protein